MSIEIKMPTLSPTMTKGVISSWLVNVGDNVSAGDIIAEIETDKVLVEIEAESAGVVAQITAPEGAEVPVDDVIMVLGAEGEAIAAAPAPVVEVATAEAPTSVETIPIKTQPIKTQPIHATDISMSPLARRMAAQENINLESLKGSGSKGRIMKRDVEQLLGTSVEKALIQAKSATATAEPEIVIDYQNLPEYTSVKNSGMRSTVATRLTQSSRDIPHFYMTVDCQIDELMAMRKQLNGRKNADYKISVNDFVIKAVATAMKQVPEANCMWAGDSVISFNQVDIAIAVAVKDGLITPVVKNASGKGLADIANQSKALALAAREGKLQPAQYQGGTFTISNLGMFGIKEFTSIINPPQNGILSVGVGEQRPVVKDGELAIATVMSVTLAMDHRCVDGATGARFIQAFKNIIEDPISLML
ncbi:MAG: pyruvate dehydrogenase complex dihydrolipoamide acetyltransferase [Algicola sp.]|nr:pyruvate dehydrogenase complex dihydrolipoamide acetyltransferase [Algicola sp.]